MIASQRRRQDSNLRMGCPINGLASRRHRPLGHASVALSSGARCYHAPPDQGKTYETPWTSFFTPSSKSTSMRPPSTATTRPLPNLGWAIRALWAKLCEGE